MVVDQCDHKTPTNHDSRRIQQPNLNTQTSKKVARLSTHRVIENSEQSEDTVPLASTNSLPNDIVIAYTMPFLSFDSAGPYKKSKSATLPSRIAFKEEFAKLPNSTGRISRDFESCAKAVKNRNPDQDGHVNTFMKKQNSTTTRSSSSFLIESASEYEGTIGPYSWESPIPSALQTSNVIASLPFQPQFEATSVSFPGEVSVRQAVINNQNRFFMEPVDYFQEHMEERLVRWRPNGAHLNIDATLNGNHPYQLSSFWSPSRFKQQSNGLSSLTKWFLGNKDAAPLQNSSVQASCTDHEDNTSGSRNNVLSDSTNIALCSTTHCSAKQTITKEPSLNSNQPQQQHTSAQSSKQMGAPREQMGASKDLPDFSNFLSKNTFKANSSNSFITSPVLERCSPGSMTVFVSPSTDVVNSQPGRIPEPLYTAHAVPFNGTDLNFDKLESSLVYDGMTRSNGGNILDDGILGSVDGDVYAILHDITDTFNDCFDGLRSIAVTLTSFCSEYY